MTMKTSMEQKMSNFEKELLQSLDEARAIARGEMKPARIFIPPDVDVAAIRKRLGLSQSKFAARFGLTHGAIRDWEQRRRRPDPAARVLLTVIDREPEAVERALAAVE
jgi:putative transcriptional regulator